MAVQERSTAALPAWGEALLARAVPAAAGCLVLIVALDLLGSHALGEPATAFDLDGERNVPALFSSCLFGASAVTAFGLHHVMPDRAPGRTAALVLAIVLAFMAVDEAAMLHERLVGMVDAVHWTVWYLPIVGTAIGAGVRVSRAYPVARRPFTFTFTAWFLSGFLEMASWDEARAMQPWGAVLVEETLEMLAVFALLVGLVRALQHATAGPARAVA